MDEFTHILLPCLIRGRKDSGQEGRISFTDPLSGTSTKNFLTVQWIIRSSTTLSMFVHSKR